MTKLSFVPCTVVRRGCNGQRGATLIVGLIMLVLITLMVISAFNLSSSNLKSVGNMQAREEAVAATNQAVEQLISTVTASTPSAQSSIVALATATQINPTSVDINNDSKADFSVQPVVTCIRAVIASDALPSDVELAKTMTTGAFWNADFDIKATTEDLASGAKVEAHQGIRVRLSEVDKNAACL